MEENKSSGKESSQIKSEIFEMFGAESSEKKGELVYHSKERDEFEIRKDKIIKFFKEKANWVYYLILGFIVYISIYIRTRNMPRLIDQTTGTWTLGPDLDPFLFLRWAKYIVANGSLMAVDMMRYSPIGYDTIRELKLHSYLIAWFHNFISFFSKEITVTYSAVIFPVFMFALTAIAFFLFARKIFYKENEKVRNIIALIATALFVLVPSLLPRTIAGIPEKESAAFFFLFISLYFFMEAFSSEKLKRGLIFGALAGITTAGMSLIWGGMIFLYFGISTMFLIVFLLGKVSKKEFYIYSIWLFTSFALMIPEFKSGFILQVFAVSRYSIPNLIKSTSTGLAIGIFAIVGISLFIMGLKNEKLKRLKNKIKLPKEAFSFLISLIIILILVFISFGPSFVFDKTSEVKNSLVSPLVTRFGVTVAENRQPYFSEWKGSFGPIYFKIPLFFWMFFIGSVFHRFHAFAIMPKPPWAETPITQRPG